MIIVMLDFAIISYSNMSLLTNTWLGSNENQPTVVGMTKSGAFIN